MKADSQTEKEVLAALQALTTAVRNRDLKSVLEMFVPEDEVLFVGSEAGVSARGMEQLSSC